MTFKLGLTSKKQRKEINLSKSSDGDGGRIFGLELLFILSLDLVPHCLAMFNERRQWIQFCQFGHFRYVRALNGNRSHLAFEMIEFVLGGKERNEKNKKKNSSGIDCSHRTWALNSGWLQKVLQQPNRLATAAATEGEEAMAERLQLRSDTQVCSKSFIQVKLCWHTHTRLTVDDRWIPEDGEHMQIEMRILMDNSTRAGGVWSKQKRLVAPPTFAFDKPLHHTTIAMTTKARFLLTLGNPGGVKFTPGAGIFIPWIYRLSMNSRILWLLLFLRDESKLKIR